ncbi:MAG: triose-phosphate isomerase [Deferribacteraceae bacterium]|jgi:triosephosphate isomerase|nr:triose-phosphate isomerase [Deferribacteraceae bacterium]
MRKPLIAANWKMFLNLKEALSLAASLSKVNTDGEKDIFIAPSFTNMAVVAEELKKSAPHISVAAQNFYLGADDASSGAYTGEVSLPMIKSAGATAVILGHSERRNIFGEDDAFINRKVKCAIAEGLTAILCVGELLAEREASVQNEVVLAQLGKSLAQVADLTNVVIAYEPVWAIGTGKTATPAGADEMHNAIRTFIGRYYGKSASNEIRILYGGSVKPDNIKALMQQGNIDGALVGGASLNAEQFEKIINY